MTCQLSFLPLEFLERALPVLKVAGPLLTRQRGFPQGRQRAFLAEVRRCTSKKSHRLQPAAGPESVWTGAPSHQVQIPGPAVPEPSTPAPNHLPVSLQNPPPKRNLAQGTGGLAAAPMGMALGLEQACPHGSWQDQRPNTAQPGKGTFSRPARL